MIFCSGGKAESLHTKEGQTQTQEADDQLAGDKSVRALLNTHKLGRPVVLLIDDKYRLFPYDLASDGYTYVVLGFYRIAHAWGVSLSPSVAYSTDETHS